MIVNVLDKLPKRLQRQATILLREIAAAPTRAEAERLRDTFAGRYAEFPEAASCLERDWEMLTAFYDLPAEHWKHLRTSNVVESPFASLRLRTDAARRFKNVDNATMLIWKVMRVAESRWRKQALEGHLRREDVHRRDAHHASHREGSRLIISTPIDASSRQAHHARDREGSRLMPFTHILTRAPTLSLPARRLMSVGPWRSLALVAGERVTT